MSQTKITDAVRTVTAVDGTKINAVDGAKITTGTIPEARITSLDATKLTGNIASARIPAAAVTQHVTGYNDATVRSDILKLAIHQGVDGNRAAFNLDNSFIDTFEDDTGITTETSVDRDASGEYISSVAPYVIPSTTKLLVESNTTEGSTTFTDLSSVGRAVNTRSTVSHTTTQKKFGTSSINFNGGTSWLHMPNQADLRFGTSIHTIEFWFRQGQTENGHFINKWMSGSYDAFYIHITGSKISVKANSSGSSWDINLASTVNVADNVWHHCACTLNGATLTLWLDGASQFTGTVGNSGQIYDGTGDWTIGGTHEDSSGPYTGYMEDIHFSTAVKYTGSFTPVQSNGATVSATGTLISDPQTASTSRTSASGVIIYEDGVGTNTLGTDLKIYFSCNNSAWTEANSYGTATTYSGTKKLVKLGATTCTAGTAIAMKAVWANQATGVAASPEGFNGGGSPATGNPYPAGGGGGAASVGGTPATSSSASGAGGTGKSNSITGSSVGYAGGGSGGGNSGASIGTATHGGGTGVASGTGGAATANTGGGGGGGQATGGAGGSGIIVIRALTSETSGSTGNWDATAADGSYTYYKWTTVTSAGSFTPSQSASYEYLVVAGGGGGGGNAAAGGGAGGYRIGTLTVSSAVSSITVSAGGAGSTSSGTSGGNSIFSTITAVGGGFGGGGGGGTIGGAGGSGGGRQSGGNNAVGGIGGASGNVNLATGKEARLHGWAVNY